MEFHPAAHTCETRRHELSGTIAIFSAVVERFFPELPSSPEEFCWRRPGSSCLVELPSCCFSWFALFTAARLQSSFGLITLGSPTSAVLSEFSISNPSIAHVVNNIQASRLFESWLQWRPHSNWIISLPHTETRINKTRGIICFKLTHIMQDCETALL